MQGLGLPLHRAGSGPKRRLPRRLRELTAAQVQIMGLVSFVAFLCFYIAYSVRGLIAQAEARQQAEVVISISQAIPEPKVDDTSVGHIVSLANADEALLGQPLQGQDVAGTAAESPPPIAFSGWRKQGAGSRREGTGHLEIGAGRDSHGPRPAPAGSPGHQRGAYAGRRDPGHAVGNNAHLPIQVRERGTSGEPSRVQPLPGGSAIGEADQRAKHGQEAPQSPRDRTAWLIEELHLHYRNACQGTRLQPGGVPEQACKRLQQVGQSLGGEQRAEGGVSPHLVALLQGQSFGLIEAVRQSLGTARPGGDVMTRAVVVMKELSMLAHMQHSAGDEGTADEFLDAHVGSHFEAEDRSASGGQRVRAGGGDQGPPWPSRDLRKSCLEEVGSRRVVGSAGGSECSGQETGGAGGGAASSSANRIRSHRPKQCPCRRHRQATVIYGAWVGKAEHARILMVCDSV